MQPRSHRALGVTVAGLLLAGLLSGCASSDDTDITDVVGAASAAPSQVGTSGTPTPTATATATAAATAPSTAPSTGTSTAPATSAAPVPTPSSAGAAGPSAALRSARRDVASIAPQLESYYRDREYPVDLAQVKQTFADSGVTLSAGNTLGGYAYDGDAVEFVLCIENTSGAWASYDTAPMTLQQSGESGGCP